MIRRPKNFIEIMELRKSGVPAYVTNGDFLDEFYAAPNRLKQSFLDDEPPLIKGVEITPSALAQFAAIAEKLAHDYDLHVPEWTSKPIYYLDTPYLAGKPANEYPRELIECLIDETPIEFSKRNLIVTDNILERR